MNDNLNHIDEDDQESLEISKSQRKRDMLALQDLGKQLVELSQDQFNKMTLPEKLHDAVAEARNIHQHGARKRQLQYIGRLMRELDPTPIQEQLDTLHGNSQAAVQLLHEAEEWRDRLLSNDAHQLEYFIQQNPHTDRQYLRQLIRNAQREAANGKPPKSARGVFRYVREILETDR